MSFQAMTWAVGQKLPHVQKIVLLMLANYCNHTTGQCNPSYETLASECGMTARSVKEQIRKLEQAGYLKVIRRSEQGVSLPNQYLLSCSPPVKDIHHPSEPPSPRVVKDVHPNQEVEPGNEPVKTYNAAAELRRGGVAQQVIDDWLDHRAKKKAPVSQTVVHSRIREAAKACITLEQALEAEVSHGWSGFRADWWAKNKTSQANDRQAFADQLTGRGMHGRIVDIN